MTEEQAYEVLGWPVAGSLPHFIFACGTSGQPAGTEWYPFACRQCGMKGVSVTQRFTCINCNVEMTLPRGKREMSLADRSPGTYTNDNPWGVSMRKSKPGFENTYWCCAASFGQHEADCPNAPKDAK